MLELALNTRRGGFHLQVECRFASEWTVVFGPSGAGKSTLLRLLAGLDRPDHGQIVLDEKTLTDGDRNFYCKPGQRQTALVAQQPALFPHLSVAANVAYGLARLERDERNNRVEEMLELVDAKNLAHRRPRDLSGAKHSASHWQEPWLPFPACCCSMSLFRRSMALPATRCFRGCNAGSAGIVCKRC